MNYPFLVAVRHAHGAVGLFVVACVFLGCQADSAPTPTAVSEPHISAASAVDAGRYIAIIGGCNDCHTEGFMEAEGKIPESDWLTGSRLGWRGPWGTTYPPNLRLRAQEWTEDKWVTTLRTRTALPPMPWMNLNKMSERDARALYQYLRSLGPKGEHVPLPVPPDKEPVTPYLSLEPQNLPPVP